MAVEQLSGTADHLGARLGSTFVDGGVRTRFGTRNFTMPLQNGQYIEVVCPLDHPASDRSSFAQAVSMYAAEGGRWLTWVVSVNDVSRVEGRLGRQAVDGHRTKPDSHDLSCKQIGVLRTLEDKQLPFSIEWKSLDHPSSDGKSISKIVKVEIAGDEKRISAQHSQHHYGLVANFK